MSDLGHDIGKQGWGEWGASLKDMIAYENDYYDQVSQDAPIMYRSRPSDRVLPFVLKKWEDAQLAKNFHLGSRCLLTLEEVVLGRQLDWLPQDIGSCVTSNTLRPWVQRAVYQLSCRADAEEHIGTTEFDHTSIAWYGPQSYGMARKRANMKGGDGLYCEPMIESLMKDGVLKCSSDGLRNLLRRLGADSVKMYPEPIGKPSLYRAFGNWQYIEELRPLCDHRLLASVKITNVDAHLEASKQGKPMIMCSPIAIKRNGSNKDGVPIHSRNLSDQWMHNMSWSGHFYDSAGSLYFILNNKSWGPKAVYNIPAEELATWYRQGLPTCMSLEEIDLPDSPVPVI